MTLSSCPNVDDRYPPLDEAWQPAALQRSVSARQHWLGPAISVAVLAAALFQFRTLALHDVVALVPRTPLFWLALFGAYAALPASEWLIYRRLWGLPYAGIVPLLRKRISNEILLGYSGEVYFYAWARRCAGLTTAPFGVIKDVAILSAQVGNAVTLAMVVLAWPLLGTLHFDHHGRAVMLSATIVVAMSLPAMIFRRQLMTLPSRALWRIAGLHLARIVAGMLFAGLMWHEVLPHTPLGLWLVLAALRQLLSRLPLMPNKDIAFAGLAAWLAGPGTSLASMMAMVATLILALHVTLGALLAIADLIGTGERPRRGSAA